MSEIFKGVTPPQENTQTIQETASRNFSKWNSALQTGNPKEVAALFLQMSLSCPRLQENSRKGK